MDAELRVHVAALSRQVQGLKEAAAGGEEQEPLCKLLSEGDSGLQAAVRALQTAAVRRVAFTDDGSAAFDAGAVHPDVAAAVTAMGRRLQALKAAMADADEDEPVSRLVTEGNAGLASLKEALVAAQDAKLVAPAGGASSDAFHIVWGDGTVVEPSAEELAKAKAAAEAEAKEAAAATESKLAD